MRSVLSFALITLLAASGQAKDDSILPNGGFEEGLKGWLLINSSGSTTSELDRKDRKEGKQSLHLHKKSGGQPFDTLRADLPKLNVADSSPFTCSMFIFGGRKGMWD